jgi:hypothetical protein
MGLAAHTIGLAAHTMGLAAHTMGLVAHTIGLAALRGDGLVLDFLVYARAFACWFSTVRIGAVLVSDQHENRDSNTPKMSTMQCVGYHVVGPGTSKSPCYGSWGPVILDPGWSGVEAYGVEADHPCWCCKTHELYVPSFRLLSNHCNNGQMGKCFWRLSAQCRCISECKILFHWSSY